jgi:exodeoxyribonuclease V alpha subunit
VKKVGDIRFFDDCSPKDQEKYAGGFIWQCDVTSHYPDEGFRLPYHVYLERPEVLEQFAFHPDNPRLFKYATREISDDDALDLVERFLEIAGTLKERGDTSENWAERIVWLRKLVGELWRSRGLYPGTPAVLAALGFEAAIPFWKERVIGGKEQETKDALFALLEGKSKRVTGLSVEDKEAAKVVRQWKLREPEEQRLLRDVLPRFELAPDQIQRVLSKDRAESGLLCTLAEVAENPYLLCEQFAGDGPDDLITFGKVDHGVFRGGRRLAAAEGALRGPPPQGGQARVRAGRPAHSRRQPPTQLPARVETAPVHRAVPLGGRGAPRGGPRVPRDRRSQVRVLETRVRERAGR